MAISKPAPYDPPAGCLARLYWMILGNMVLALAAFAIAQRPEPRLGLWDLAYWVAVGVLLGVRYADIRWWNGRKATGQLASLVHWRRYVRLLIVTALIVWAVAQAISRYVS